MLSECQPLAPTFTLKPFHFSFLSQFGLFVIAFVPDEFKLASGNGKQGSIEIAEWFDKQNEAGWEDVLQTKRGCDVISLAHFLPHQVTITAPPLHPSQPHFPRPVRPVTVVPF